MKYIVLHNKSLQFITPEKLIPELQFKTLRSSGAGGQHVNKVATKVVLSFDITASKSLSDEEKKTLYEKLAVKISKNGVLIVASDATRSQHKNKERVIRRFLEILNNALTPVKKRKPTRRPQSANLKRLQKKKARSEKKANRRKPNY